MLLDLSYASSAGYRQSFRGLKFIPGKFVMADPSQSIVGFSCIGFYRAIGMGCSAVTVAAVPQQESKRGRQLEKPWNFIILELKESSKPGISHHARLIAKLSKASGSKSSIYSHLVSYADVQEIGIVPVYGPAHHVGEAFNAELKRYLKRFRRQFPKIALQQLEHLSSDEGHVNYQRWFTGLENVITEKRIFFPQDTSSTTLDDLNRMDFMSQSNVAITNPLQAALAISVGRMEMDWLTCNFPKLNIAQVSCVQPLLEKLLPDYMNA